MRPREAKLREAVVATQKVRTEAKALVKRALPEAETKDADHVILAFVLKFIPSGVVGLLIAVILCAAMSSTASELSGLGSTSMLDLYKRLKQGRSAAPATTPEDQRRDLLISKGFTVLWGVLAIAFASFASLLYNLIEAVNILGSIFYGTVLGLFVVAFFVKRVTATPVLIAALIAQSVVAVLFLGPRLPLVQRDRLRDRGGARLRLQAPPRNTSRRTAGADDLIDDRLIRPPDSASGRQRPPRGRSARTHARSPFGGAAQPRGRAGTDAPGGWRAEKP